MELIVTSTKIFSHQLERNRFFSIVKSKWDKAFTIAQLLPKNLAPIRILFPEQDVLIFDKAHLLSNQRGKFPTNYMVRVTGKGIRRIYKGYDVLGYTWEPILNRFCQGWKEVKFEGSYFFIEIENEKIVVIADLLNA